jgi:hypothetical protein
MVSPPKRAWGRDCGQVLPNGKKLNYFNSE